MTRLQTLFSNYLITDSTNYSINFGFFLISILFFGFLCLLFTKSSFLKTLILLELLFLLLSLLFIFFSLNYDSPEGQLLVLYILGVSACETAIGLSLFLVYCSY